MSKRRSSTRFHATRHPTTGQFQPSSAGAAAEELAEAHMPSKRTKRAPVDARNASDSEDYTRPGDSSAQTV